MNKNYFTSHLSKYFLLAFFSSIFLVACNSDNNEVDEVETTVTYNIGDEGPAGGWIFYDKGTYSDGWRYIEAAPSDLETMQWGCYNNPIEEARELEIGFGLANTEAIVNYHNNLPNYYQDPASCSDLSDGTVAAKACMDLELGGYDNWHLPSEEEVFMMYQNLHLNGIGNFDTAYLYWTSSEHDDNTATATDFSNGDQGWLCKQCDLVVIIRAARYF